jgi:ABC-2 type transport system ATP-binding protein
MTAPKRFELLRQLVSPASDGADPDRAETSAPVVAVRGLEVRYGKKRVLEELSLEIRKGEVYALLGRNGAGKTSLLRCLLGQHKATLGSVGLFGRDSWRERASLMARVAVVPERPDVPPELPVARAARFVAALRPGFDRGAFEARLDRAAVDARSPFGSLSRGQQTLVGLALALSSGPELLILDDPTLGLDAVARRAVFRELVDALAAGPLTVLLTSHDLRGVEQIATRVGFLTGGRLVLDLPLDELKARFRRLLLERGAASERSFTGTVLHERQLAWARELVVELAADELGALDSDDVEGIESLEMDLEEIFLALCEKDGERDGRVSAEEAAS